MHSVSPVTSVIQHKPSNNREVRVIPGSQQQQSFAIAAENQLLSLFEVTIRHRATTRLLTFASKTFERVWEGEKEQTHTSEVKLKETRSVNEVLTSGAQN